MAENLNEFAFVNDNPTTSDATEKAGDVERQEIHDALGPQKLSAFKSLGWLDGLLAVWIFLAMTIGILLGNFIPSVGSALQKGSNRATGHDVPHLMQSQVRDSTSGSSDTEGFETDDFQHGDELARCSLSDGKLPQITPGTRRGD
ncbi:hypothetical protein MMC22_004413 [Lobaria immixta]|nr:hypothetical protein [Lobaria immixta]